MQVRKARVLLVVACAFVLGGGAGYFGARFLTPGADASGHQEEVQLTTIDAGNFAFVFYDQERGRPISFSVEVDISPDAHHISQARARDEISRMISIILEAPVVARAADAPFTIEEALQALAGEENSWIEEIRVIRLVPGFASSVEPT